MATEVALPAFLSSSIALNSIVKCLLPPQIREDPNDFYQMGITAWKTKLGRVNLPENPLFQAEWDKPQYLLRLNTLLESASSEEDKARILAASSEHASDWLHAIPISSLGLKLANTSLRTVCALRIGSPLCQQHTCICGVEVDPMGRHGLSCKNQIGRHPRHSQVNDLVKQTLSTAEYPSRLEPPGLSRKDGKRPDGLTLHPYKEGKCLVWDFTCADTFASSHIKETSKSAGAAAVKAEKAKLAKYEEIRNNYHMVPIAVETLGSWGTEGLHFIKCIGKKIQEITGEKRSTFYLFQSISVAIQRGNAASVLGTAKPGKKLDEIFYL